jgi:hypothetical protein
MKSMVPCFKDTKDMIVPYLIVVKGQRLVYPHDVHSTFNKIDLCVRSLWKEKV